ncbi:MAG: hypothetical protein MUE64_04140 [Ignavibacteriaceae bacterium]|jgi:hypothetical protein|nr:hypothetical protein [Ignavibacteriaceae bacterium]
MLDVKSLEFVLRNNEIDGLKPIKYLTYKLIIKGVEVSVKCPVFKIREDDSKEKSVFQSVGAIKEKMLRYLPSFLIPRKKYPTYVYLYAIQYYLTNNISMRKTAEHVCSKFNLRTFSHSTISRILNKLCSSYEKLINTFTNAASNDFYVSLIIRRKWDNDRLLKIQFISSIFSSILKTPEITANKLCMDYFNQNEGEFLF